MPRSFGAALATVIVGGVAMAPATAFVIGQQGEAEGHDVMFEPVVVARPVEVVMGIAAVLVAAISVGLLVRWRTRREIDRRWLGAAACSFAAGAFVGLAYRIVTAYVTGANIGGGLVVLVGGPLLLGLVTAVTVLSSHILRDGRWRGSVSAAP